MRLLAPRHAPGPRAGLAHRVGRARPARTAIGLLLCGALLQAGEAVTRPAVSGDAVLEHVKRLASDEWEGRGSGTAGERKATDYIAAHFEALGLEPAGDGGRWFQEVAMPGPVRIGQGCLLEPAEGLAPGEQEAFVLDRDFRPFSSSAAGEVEAQVVFAGYGIQAPELAYDDYAGLQVRDRIVMVFRHAPRAVGWDAARVRRQHAPFARKLAVAARLGAAALVVVNDPAHVAGAGPTGSGAGPAAPQPDLLVRQDIGGRSGRIPFVHLTLDAARRLFPMILGASPEALEAEIAGGEAPRPASREGVRGLRIRTRIERTQLKGRNVCALLSAGAPDATDEVIVLGAHHDHLGRGGPGSLARTAEERGEIHNGADDNASGTAAVLEVARALAGRRDRLRRSVLFVTFTGEERGLFGSRRFVAAPPVARARIVAMINLDMIGRLEDRPLFIGGVKTSPAFRPMLERLAPELDLRTVLGDGGRAPSDSLAFYGAGIPVLFFCSGMHREYHRPADDWNLLDVPGMARVATLVASVTEDLARVAERPRFERADGGGFGPPRPVLGLQGGPAEGGVAVQVVLEKSGAARAGILPGDVIVALADDPTPDPAALSALLRKRRIGETVPVKIRRDGETLVLAVTLGQG